MSCASLSESAHGVVWGDDRRGARYKALCATGRRRSRRRTGRCVNLGRSRWTSPAFFCCWRSSRSRYGLDGWSRQALERAFPDSPHWNFCDLKTAPNLLFRFRGAEANDRRTQNAGVRRRRVRAAGAALPRCLASNRRRSPLCGLRRVSARGVAG